MEITTSENSMTVRTFFPNVLCIYSKIRRGVIRTSHGNVVAERVNDAWRLEEYRCKEGRLEQRRTSEGNGEEKTR